MDVMENRTDLDPSRAHEALREEAALRIMNLSDQRKLSMTSVETVLREYETTLARRGLVCPDCGKAGGNDG